MVVWRLGVRSGDLNSRKSKPMIGTIAMGSTIRYAYVASVLLGNLQHSCEDKEVSATPLGMQEDLSGLCYPIGIVEGYNSRIQEAVGMN